MILHKVGVAPPTHETTADQTTLRVAPDNSSATETNGREGASYDIFYDRLQSEGRWFSDATYGYVWQPSTASTDQHWRPYPDGRWVYTDRGWTWVSNEDFGWATYHYGRWVRLSDTGWVWVPGATWAPAWVSWRQSDDYVGWAPLPPEAESGRDFRIEGWADSYYNIGPTSYVFVKAADLPNKSYRDLIASPRDNLDIISPGADPAPQAPPSARRPWSWPCRAPDRELQRLLWESGPAVLERLLTALRGSQPLWP